MGMLERILKDHVFIDFGCDIRNGEDQAYLVTPCRFPTVRFQLVGTSLLCELVDRIRKDAGYVPLYPLDEYTDANCDGDAWYDFFIGISGWHENMTDSGIEAVLCNSRSADEGERYTIDLSTEEQCLLYNRLNDQCVQYLGMSCEELLDKARKEMENDE